MSLVGALRSGFSLFVERLLRQVSIRLLFSDGCDAAFARLMDGPLETLDPLAKRTADLGEFSCTEDYEDDYQDDQHFGHAYSEHGFISLSQNVFACLLDHHPGIVKYQMLRIPTQEMTGSL